MEIIEKFYHLSRVSIIYIKYMYLISLWIRLYYYIFHCCNRFWPPSMYYTFIHMYTIQTLYMSNISTYNSSFDRFIFIITFYITSSTGKMDTYFLNNVPIIYLCKSIIVGWYRYLIFSKYKTHNFILFFYVRKNYTT